MNIRQLLAISSFTCLALGLTGCATTGAHVVMYDGPQRSTNEVALLKVQQSVLSISAHVESVDDAPISKGKKHLNSNTKEIEFLPGTHKLEFSYSDSNGGQSIINQVLTFTCKSGGVYELHVAPFHRSFGKVLTTSAFGGTGAWTGWILDAQSNDVIAGYRPEEPLRWYEK